MPDKKLTDAEIVKALECKPKAELIIMCNRLQAENERLQLEIEAVNELINPLPFKSNFDKAIETAKVEAYKEFLPLLEKFRDEVVDKFIIMCDGNDYNKLNLMSMVDTIDCIYDKHIENLLKELVGEDNG